jgi:signal transduction histidine kinase
MDGTLDEPAGANPPSDLAFHASLTQLAERADELADSQQKLQALIKATHELSSAPLDVATLLPRIVETATRLVHARYGAIGVVGDDGLLAQFIPVGVDERTAAAIGELPRGRGLLGVVIRDPVPLRTDHIGDHAESVGFPDHHPPMESFLGVPIHSQGLVYGHLYLTGAAAGAFSADDEELVRSLAGTAGVAIANARLYEDATYRGTWSSALVETARILMRDDDDPIQLLIETARVLGSADLVCVARPGPVADRTMLTHAVGLGSDTAVGLSFATAGSLLETAVLRGEPVVVDDLHAVKDYGIGSQALLGHTVVVPFAVGDGTTGVLTLARTREHGKFDDRDVEMARSVAAHIGMVKTQAITRATHRKLSLLLERQRIARDLHDHVIQRLYATGLSLSSVANSLSPGTAADRVMAQVVEIDRAIAQIRQSILTLHAGADDLSPPARLRIREIVEGASAGFEERPSLTFRGPIDLMSDPELVDDLAAVVREALANAARHGRARLVAVLVGAADGHISVTVTDDGIGIGDPTELSGLARCTRVRRAPPPEYGVQGRACRGCSRRSSSPSSRPGRSARRSLGS